MAQFPALPLFTDAFLGDTLHLNAMQIGAYMLMLMTAWRAPTCDLPNDDLALSRITRLDKRTWRINREVLLAFWSLNQTGRWEQGRLKDERKYVEQLSNKNSCNAKARWLKNKESYNTTAMPDRCQNDAPIPTPILTKEKNTKKESFPEWIPQQDWGDYLKMRVSIKKPMTDRAIALAISKLSDLRANGHDPALVLQQSVFNAWQGLFAPKKDFTQPAKSPKKNVTTL